MNLFKKIYYKWRINYKISCFDFKPFVKILEDYHKFTEPIPEGDEDFAYTNDTTKVVNVFALGDAHIYKNHIEPLKEQLTRNPHMYALPTLKLNPAITEIDDFTYEDIKIEGYKSYPVIKMPLSVGL